MVKYDVQVLDILRGMTSRCCAMDYRSGRYFPFVVWEARKGVWAAALANDDGETGKYVTGDSFGDAVQNLLGVTNVTKAGRMKPCTPQECAGSNNKLVDLVHLGYDTNGHLFAVFSVNTTDSPNNCLRCEISDHDKSPMRVWFGYHVTKDGTLELDVMQGSKSVGYLFVSGQYQRIGFGSFQQFFPLNSFEECLRNG